MGESVEGNNPTLSKVAEEDLRREKRKQLISDLEDKLSQLHDEENKEVKLITYISENSLVPDHTVGFEDMLQSVGEADVIYLMIDSPGGDPETALRVIKMFRERADSFRTVVPDMAKSAATQICLGSNIIHMGSNSELGPIDPQIPFQGRYVGAQTIIDGWKRIKENARESEDVPVELYATIAQGLSAVKLEEAEKSVEYIQDQSVEIAGHMFDEDEKAEDCIEELLSIHPHSKVIDYERADNLGIKTKDLRNEDSIWDTTWELYIRSKNNMSKREMGTMWETTSDSLGLEREE